MSLLKIIGFIIRHPLNREHKINAVIRFLRWQIGSRLISGEIVYNWVRGARFLVRTGETGLTGNIYTGLHEFPDMGYLLHVLRAGDLFVDVGANVGSYTILACSVAGARGVAFEPVPDTYNRLVENMRINHLDKQVTTINAGVGARQGLISFTSGDDTANHALAADEDCANVIDVEVSTLDVALCGKSPSLIKIDVEGYESFVLEGAREILKNKVLHSVIMELNGSGERYGCDEAEILKLMSGYGFKPYSYNPLTRTLVDLKGKNMYSGNTLFIRDRFLVEKILRDAPVVSVGGKMF